MIIYIPAQLVECVVVGEALFPILTVAFIGVPAYLNSYAAPTLVSGLLDKGLNARGLMAVLVVGAISCIQLLTAVWSIVNHSTFLFILPSVLGGQ